MKYLSASFVSTLITLRARLRQSFRADLGRGTEIQMNLERFIAASLIVHALIVAALLRFEAPSFESSKNIEVTILDQRPQKNRQQFVADPNLQPLKKAIDALKEKAAFLSRETQRVKEQSIARNTGRTQNAQNQNRQSRSSENGSSEKNRPFPRPNETSDMGGNQPSINRPAQVAERVMLSDSTIAEYIPDVKRGGFTSLNTDQFMYYTFYARINEQIRNRWVNNLRAFSDNAGPNEMNRLSAREQVTELEVILDKEGNYKKTVLHRNSENSDLDAAASYAISQAAPFLNPPSEIVQEDGMIHLYYQFHIQWRPQYLAGPKN